MTSEVECRILMSAQFGSIRRAMMMAAIFIASVAGGHAHAQPGSGDTVQKVLPQCRQLVLATKGTPAPNTDYLQVMDCAGRVTALLAIQQFLAPEFKSCRPEGITVGQAAAVIVKQLEDLPDKWHMDFHIAALAILQGTWPCR